MTHTTSIQRAAAALACGLLLVCGSAACAAEDALDVKAAEAEKYLADTSFYERWSAAGAIDSPATASKVKNAAEKELERIGRAMKDVQQVCVRRFFVNKCEDDARRISFERQREIRRVIVAADEVIRADRVRRTEERRAKNAAQERAEPVRIAPKAVKTDRPDPVKLAPKRPGDSPLPQVMPPAKVREPSAPAGIKPAEVKPAAAPDLIPGSQTGVSPDAGRSALEKANEDWYAQKQQDAARRAKAAEERAEKRRLDREAKQKRFEKSLEERSAAQQRYEERQQNRESGLAKYF